MALDHRYTCLPHFIIGGVPKAGTTSLYKYLLQHPEVCCAAKYNEACCLRLWPSPGSMSSADRFSCAERVHAQVLPAKDKELTFWGNFFTPKRRPGREEVMATYLDKFPYVAPTDFKVTPRSMIAFDV